MSTYAFIYGTRDKRVNTVPFQSFLHPPRTIDLKTTLESRDILRSILVVFALNTRIVVALRIVRSVRVFVRQVLRFRMQCHGLSK